MHKNNEKKGMAPMSSIVRKVGLASILAAGTVLGAQAQTAVTVSQTDANYTTSSGGVFTLTGHATEVLEVSNTASGTNNGSGIVLNDGTTQSDNQVIFNTATGTSATVYSSAGSGATIDVQQLSVVDTTPGSFGIQIDDQAGVWKTGGSGSAIAVQNSVSISNSGVILVTGGTGGSVVSVTGGTLNLVNAGEISSTVSGTEGIYIGSSGTVSLTNSGIIQTAGGGTAIDASAAGATVSQLVNTGTISSSGVAINLRGDTGATTVALNGGTVIGDILLGGTATDTLQIGGSGVSFNGGVHGISTTGWTFDVNADYTHGGTGTSLTNVTTIDLATGVDFVLGNNTISNTENNLGLTITGTGGLDITGFTGNAIDLGSGTLTLAAGGASLTSDNAAIINAQAMNISGTILGIASISDSTGNGVTLRNTGTIDELTFGNGASVTINNAGFISDTGGNAGQNAGVLAGTNSIVNFTNSGTVQVAQNAEVALDFSASNISLTTFTNTGSIFAQDRDDTALDVTGDTLATTLTFGSGSSVTGIIQMGGTLSDTLNITAAGVNIDGDILGDASVGGTLDVDADFAFDDGTGNVIGNMSMIDIASGASLTIGANNLISLTNPALAQTITGTGVLVLDDRSGIAVNAYTSNGGVTLGSGLTVSTDEDAVFTGDLTLNGATISGTLAVSSSTVYWNNTGLTVAAISGTVANAESLYISVSDATGGAITNVDTISITNDFAINHATTGVNTAFWVSGTGNVVTAAAQVSGSGALTLGTGATLQLSDTTNGFYIGTLSAPSGVSSTLKFATTSSTAAELVVQSGAADFSRTAFEFDFASTIADGTTMTLVNANGASTFSGTVSETSVIYSVALSVDGNNDIIATFSRDGGFDDLASNGQNATIGAALEGIVSTATGELATIINEMSNLNNAAQINTALETLNPIVDGVSTASMDLQTSSMNTVSDRLAYLRGYGVNGVATGDGMYSDHMWVQAFGSAADQGERNGIEGFEATGYGFAFGFDSEDWIEGGVTGVALSYGNSSVDSKAASNAETNVDSYQLTGYYSTDLDMGMYVDGMASFAYNSYETERTIIAGSTRYNVKGDYNGWQGSARVASGKRYAMGDNMMLTPEVSLQYTHLAVEDYTETGAGGASLNVNPDGNNALTLGLGGAASWDFEQASGAVLRGELRAVYSYDLLGDEFTTTSSFVGSTATSFKTEGAKVAQHGITLGAGAKLLDVSGVEFGIDYDATIKADYVNHQGQLKARWAF